jgi:hypothetical protein
VAERQPKLRAAAFWRMPRSSRAFFKCSPTVRGHLKKAHLTGSILVTSNRSLVRWSQVFGIQLIATAILDRLLHHSAIVDIRGESYRLQEKRKAGLPGGRHLVVIEPATRRRGLTAPL